MVKRKIPIFFIKMLQMRGTAWQNFTQAQCSHMVALHGRRTLASMVLVTQERNSP